MLTDPGGVQVSQESRKNPKSSQHPVSDPHHPHNGCTEWRWWCCRSPEPPAWFIRKADIQSLSSGPGPGLVGQRCLLCLFLPCPVLLLRSLCLSISLELTSVSLPFHFANSQLQLRIALKAFLSLPTPPTTLGSDAWSRPSSSWN